MRGLGFEPRYALSNDGLNVARLTTPASPHKKMIKRAYKKVLFFIYDEYGDDEWVDGMLFSSFVQHIRSNPYRI